MLGALAVVWACRADPGAEKIVLVDLGVLMVLPLVWMRISGIRNGLSARRRRLRSLFLLRCERFDAFAPGKIQIAGGYLVRIATAYHSNITMAKSRASGGSGSPRSIT